MRNGEKLEYPIELYPRKKDGVVTILFGAFFLVCFVLLIPNAKGFDKFMTYLCLLLGILLVLTGLSNAVGKKPMYVLTYDGITLNSLLRKQFFAWKDISYIYLKHSVIRTQYSFGGGAKLWQCNLVTNNGKTKYLALPHLKIKEDELNIKEVYHLIEQSFEQYRSNNKKKYIDTLEQLLGADESLAMKEDLDTLREGIKKIEELRNNDTSSHRVEPLTHKSIVMTRDDYRKESTAINKWFALAIIVGFIAVLIFSAS